MPGADATATEEQKLMTLEAFTASLGGAAPPPGLSDPLAALWWARRNAWDRAHALAQDDPGPEGAWVHAFLHRCEGDLGNAGYWYRRAGRPMAEGALDAEWEIIAASLLRPARA